MDLKTSGVGLFRICGICALIVKISRDMNGGLILFCLSLSELQLNDLQRSQSLTGLDKAKVEPRQSFHAWREDTGASLSDTNLPSSRNERISLNFRWALLWSLLIISCNRTAAMMGQEGWSTSSECIDFQLASFVCTTNIVTTPLSFHSLRDCLQTTRIQTSVKNSAAGCCQCVVYETYYSSKGSFLFTQVLAN